MQRSFDVRSILIIKKIFIKSSLKKSREEHSSIVTAENVSRTKTVLIDVKTV